MRTRTMTTIKPAGTDPQRETHAHPAAPDGDDRGLIFDVEVITRRILGRRRALSWVLCGGAAALVAGCGGDGSGNSSTASSSSSSDSSSSSSSSGSSSASSDSCIADPQATNGPYPADGTNSVNGSVVDVLGQSGIVRSDIRSSFGSSTTTALGVPLTLNITLVDTNTACELLSGYAIYVWHCNRDGEYSLYSTDIQNENYLRGVQTTDSNGQVTFTTIFPACYSGRYPHIHFEIYPSLAKATGQTNAVLTSQMAMPRDIASALYADSTTDYSGSSANLAAVTTSSDLVFSAFTSAQLAAATPSMSGDDTAGYVANVTIGIAV